DDVVRRVRIGAQPGPATRVVLDLEQGGRHSVYTLYNPYRIVVDVERPRADAARAPLAPSAPAAKPALVPVAPPSTDAAIAAAIAATSGPAAPIALPGAAP